MSIRITALLGLFICLNPGFSVAAGIDRTLNALGFEERPIPGGDALSHANRSGQSFTARVVGNRLSIKPESKQSPVSNRPRVLYRAGPIRYEGADRGEWGGQLVAIFPDGQRKTLLNKNVVAILSGEKQLLVYTGLAHLGPREGAVYRVQSPDRDPRLEHVVRLPDAPVLVINDPRNKHLGTKLVVGSASLMLVGRNGQDDYLKILARDQFWWALYPNSAVMIDNHLVIGMRSGLVVVHLEGFAVRSIRYFVPRTRKAGT